MKPLFVSIGLGALAFAALPALAQPHITEPERVQQATAAATSHATVDLNQDRKPSFYTRDKDGTTVTEFRDRGKLPEIDVHSGFGTNYHMAQPLDSSPKIRDNNSQDQRLPSVGLKF